MSRGYGREPRAAPLTVGGLNAESFDADSLVALAALLAVSAMMLARGVLVHTAGPGLAIVAGVLGRRVLEAVIAARGRRRQSGGAAPMDMGTGN